MSKTFWRFIAILVALAVVYVLNRIFGFIA
jgi:hypothetical protein